jgi:nicotinamide mononucleotide transporter
LSVLEILGVFFGLIYLALITYHARIGWIFGSLSSGIYSVICWNQELYIQTFLQFTYVLLGLIGFIQWNSNNNNNIHLLIKRATRKQHVIYIFIGLILSFCLGKWFSMTSQQYPYLDSLISMISLLATILATKSILENWIYWVFGNSLAIVLFISLDLYATSFLYFIYLCGSIFGYYNWKKLFKKQSNPIKA